MNGSPIFLFNRRTILRVIVVIGVGFALTATALRLLAQDSSPGVVPDETSGYTYAANFPSVSPYSGIAIASCLPRSSARYRCVSRSKVLNASGLPAGDSVGVASSQSGFYPNP